MNNKFDIIIIGAGLAGLTAGATLAKAGKKVLVLEQHNIVGGCATVFKRKNVKFDVGLHEIEMPEKKLSVKYPIFKRLGIWDRINVIPLPELWKIKSEKYEIVIPEGQDNIIKVLEKEFPDEKKGIRKYFKSINKVLKASKRTPYDMNFLEFLLYPITAFPTHLYDKIKQHTTGEMLDSMIKSDKLKRILDINLGYYHDNPYEFSWFYHSYAQSAYYNTSAYIKGGGQSLSDALADVILENNGEIKVNCDVGKILVDNNKAIGVEYYDKKSKENIQVLADKVISNSAPYNVYNQLLPKGFEDKKISNLKNSVSCCSLYIIFKKKFSKVYKGGTYSTMITSDEMMNAPFKDKAKSVKSIPIENRNISFIDYSIVDSGLTEEGDDRSFGVATFSSYLDEWDHLSTEEYKEKKKLITENILNRLDKHFPNIKDNIEYCEFSTPKTIKRYIKTPEGTAYGFKQNDYLNGGRVGFSSPTVKNLYFCGAWGFPGGGFTAVISNGYMLARHILFPLPLYMVGRILISIGVSAGVIALLLKLFI